MHPDRKIAAWVEDVSTFGIDNEDPFQGAALRRGDNEIVDVHIREAVADYHQLCVRLRQVPPKRVVVPLQHLVLADHEILVAPHDEQAVATAGKPVARPVKLKMRLEPAIDLEWRLFGRPTASMLIANTGYGRVYNEPDARSNHAVPTRARRQKDVILIL